MSPNELDAEEAEKAEKTPVKFFEKGFFVPLTEGDVPHALCGTGGVYASQTC